MCMLVTTEVGCCGPSGASASASGGVLFGAADFKSRVRCGAAPWACLGESTYPHLHRRRGEARDGAASPQDRISACETVKSAIGNRPPPKQCGLKAAV